MLQASLLARSMSPRWWVCHRSWWGPGQDFDDSYRVTRTCRCAGCDVSQSGWSVRSPVRALVDVGDTVPVSVDRFGLRDPAVVAVAAVQHKRRYERGEH